MSLQLKRHTRERSKDTHQVSDRGTNTAQCRVLKANMNPDEFVMQLMSPYREMFMFDLHRIQAASNRALLLSEVHQSELQS